MKTGVLASGLVALHIAGCAAGVLLGYSLAKKKLVEEYQEALETEVIATKKFYAIINKVDIEPETISEKPPVEIPEEIKPILDKYAGRTERIQYHTPPEKPPIEEINSNIFADVKEQRPELITEAEFMENGPEYDQVSYTYYAGDGVLADTADEMVEDIEPDVGLENLEHFGEGDWDPNLLYIMNRRIATMFEIALSQGSYAVEVQGLEPDK